MAEGEEMVSVPRGEWEALKRLEERVSRLERGPAAEAEETTPGLTADGRTDRRGLLKHGAMLAAGAVVGGAGLAVAAAQPAAADGPYVLLGNESYAQSSTEVESATGFGFIGRCDTAGLAGLYGDDESPSPGGYGLYSTSDWGTAVYGLNFNGGSPAVAGSTDGTGPAVQGVINNSVSTAPAVEASTNAAGPAVSGLTSGVANAIVGQVSNASSSAYGVYGTTNGTGPAIVGQVTNPASSSAGVVGLTNGTGPGFGGLNLGSGPAISGQNWGSGAGIVAGIVSPSNSQAAMAASTAGTGIAVQATATGTGSRGGVFAGVAAQAQLKPGTGSTHPTAGQVGDLYVDSGARLWFCKVGGVTATWTQIA